MASTEPDRIQRLGGSVVQHGKHNDRVYVMKIDASDLPRLVGEIERLVRVNAYTKVFAKVPAALQADFLAAGYDLEARVPGLYAGTQDGLFLGKFFSPERQVEPHPDEVRAVLEACQPPHRALPPLPPGVRIFPLDGRHAEDLAALYSQVFQSYPFPIDDPQHLRAAMIQDVVFYGAFESGRLLAASSAEMDPVARNAEMTDFATHPDARRKGLAGNLLRRMEHDMAETGIGVVYTIARATSFGMNTTFARGGYTHAGKLASNTQIAGHFESMNVWYRRLAEAA